MDDDQLVQRVLQGDGDTFSVLFHRYNSFICRIISHIVHNKQDMEDIAESTWEKAWKNLSTLRDRSSFKSYLTTIGKREALDHIRRKARKQEDSNKEIDGVVDQRSVEEEIEMAILFEGAMGAAMGKMRPEQVKCFHYHLQGCTSEAIAARLALTEGTVRTYISNAKKILYKELCKRLDGDQNNG